MWRAVCLVIVKQVATVPIPPTDSSDTFVAKGIMSQGYIQLIMPTLIKG